MKKIRWGIISTAKIGREKVIPGMQKSTLCEVVAISSRNLESAQQLATQLGIAKAYGSYEAMLEDPEIDAVYNPLPNHLHVPWSIASLKAGKHVLCEKPIALNADEAYQLLEAAKQYPDLKIMEAFMYRFHPQWTKAKEVVDSGVLGQVQKIQAFFSYFNVDPENIRNIPDIGGGGLLDIGCYCISFSRFLFDAEPKRVVGLVEFDPKLRTDHLASAILDYTGGRSSSFTCSTQLMPYQRCLVVGTEGWLEIKIPVNAPIDEETDATLVTKDSSETIVFPKSDQYELLNDVFCRAVLDGTEVPTPMEDAVNNMKAIDAIFKSQQNARWVSVQ
ncbi:MAG: Gfo/Idh/MocA family oxidoreductase [Saprospiraceae bacterium]|nr:Gfo/Idh/MocA family oxidoreductase [Saprospiraceae bacterium]